MGKNYLIEVTPVKPDGQLATIRMSRRGVSNAGVNLDNKEWLPLLETLPTFSLNLMSSGQLQIPTISYGDLEFICSDAYGNEEWSSYDWSNALASCWYGEDGDPFSEYTQVFAGRVSGFNRQEISSPSLMVSVRLFRRFRSTLCIWSIRFTAMARLLASQRSMTSRRNSTLRLRMSPHIMN